MTRHTWVMQYPSFSKCPACRMEREYRKSPEGKWIDYYRPTRGKFNMRRPGAPVPRCRPKKGKVHEDHL